MMRTIVFWKRDDATIPVLALALQLCASYEDAAISCSSTILRSGIQRLVRDAQRGEFDILLAEALDRISRDQADVGTLYKHLKFAGASIVTVATSPSLKPGGGRGIDVEPTAAGAAVLKGGRATFVASDDLILHEDIGRRWQTLASY